MQQKNLIRLEEKKYIHRGSKVKYKNNTIQYEIEGKL